MIWLRLILVVLVFVLIASHLFLHVDEVPFHGDESGWISEGYYFYQLFFVQHDFTLEKWRAKRFEAPEINMVVGKYCIGFGMSLVLPKADYLYKYNWNKSTEENRRNGDVPAMDVLLPGRYASAAVSFAACIAMFWFCWKTWNWIVAILAALILAFNPTFTISANRAMFDSYVLFFLILCQCFCVVLFRNGHKSKGVMWALGALMGLVAGLCISSKLNGLICLSYPSLLLCYLFFLATDKKDALIRYAPAVLLTIVVSAVTTILLNPIFYSSSLKIIAGRFLYIIRMWGKFTAHHQQVFPAAAVHGFPLIVLKRLAVDYFHPILFCALVVGFIVCVARIIRDFRTGTASAAINPVVFFLINFFVVGVWIPLDWDRYYLPILIAQVPLAAFGLFWIGEKLIQLLMRRSPIQEPSPKPVILRIS